MPLSGEELQASFRELHEKVQEISEQLAALNSTLNAERESRKIKEEAGVSILKLKVPFLLWWVSFGGALSIALAGGMFVKSAQEHMNSKALHVDPELVFRYDGVAYNRPLKDAREQLAADIDRKQRLLVRNLKAMSCVTPHGATRSTKCDFIDPAAEQ